MQLFACSVHKVIDRTKSKEDRDKRGGFCSWTTSLCGLICDVSEWLLHSCSFSLTFSLSGVSYLCRIAFMLITSLLPFFLQIPRTFSHSATYCHFFKLEFHLTCRYIKLFYVACYFSCCSPLESVQLIMIITIIINVSLQYFRIQRPLQSLTHSRTQESN